MHSAWLKQVAVAKTPAKGTVCPRDGVIKAQIKPLDMSNKRRNYSLEAPVTKVRRLDDSMVKKIFAFNAVNFNSVH